MFLLFWEESSQLQGWDWSVGVPVLDLEDCSAAERKAFSIQTEAISLGCPREGRYDPCWETGEGCPEEEDIQNICIIYPMLRWVLKLHHVYCHWRHPVGKRHCCFQSAEEEAAQ